MGHPYGQGADGALVLMVLGVAAALSLFWDIISSFRRSPAPEATSCFFAAEFECRDPACASGCAARMRGAACPPSHPSGSAIN